ncbi:MAG: hypothetical protein ACWA44_02755 [Thiotrichales bacterium]
MQWISTKKKLPETSTNVYESPCTYEGDEVSEQIMIFCEGDDQYYTGWFFRDYTDGDFFEIHGIGDAAVEDVMAWMPIPVLTDSSISK